MKEKKIFKIKWKKVVTNFIHQIVLLMQIYILMNMILIPEELVEDMF